MTLINQIKAASEVDYDKAYRLAHPRMFPFSPWERQRELSNLWPSEQEKFRKIVDAALKARGEG